MITGLIFFLVAGIASCTLLWAYYATIKRPLKMFILNVTGDRWWGQIISMQIIPIGIICGGYWIGLFGTMLGKGAYGLPVTDNTGSYLLGGSVLFIILYTWIIAPLARKEMDTPNQIMR